MTPIPQPPAPVVSPWTRLFTVFLWVAALGFVLGTVRVALALHTGQVWANYRGELITREELRHTLLLFIVSAALCTLLALRWQRLLRRGS